MANLPNSEQTGKNSFKNHQNIQKQNLRTRA